MNLDRYQKFVLAYAIIVSILAFPYIDQVMNPRFNLDKAKKSTYINPQLEPMLKNEFTSWGINPEYREGSIKLDKALEKVIHKKKIVVALIDTGIQYNHPFLKDNIYTVKGKVKFNNFGMDFTGNGKRPTAHDYHGHGTQMAGIIKSVNHKVQILALKYYKQFAKGKRNMEASNKALRYAIDNNVDIINYSGGGPRYDIEEYSLLKEAQRKGILVIVASGNEGLNIDQKNNTFYPANYTLDNIISVNAHDEYTKLIKASNYGSRNVDISAPGYRIKSSNIGSHYGYGSGTSQATAFVSGVASLILASNPNLNYKDVKSIIINSSDKIKHLKGLSGGKLNANRAIEMAYNKVKEKRKTRELTSKN